MQSHTFCKISALAAKTVLLFPLSWLTPTVHSLLHKEIHTSCPASSYCAMFDFSALLTFVELCVFCLENSSMELWHCPGHGTGSICKDPVVSGLSFWWIWASRAAVLSVDEDLVLPWWCTDHWAWIPKGCWAGPAWCPHGRGWGAERHLKPYTELWCEGASLQSFPQTVWMWIITSFAKSWILCLKTNIFWYSKKCFTANDLNRCLLYMSRRQNTTQECSDRVC